MASPCFTSNNTPSSEHASVFWVCVLKGRCACRTLSPKKKVNQIYRPSFSNKLEVLLPSKKRAFCSMHIIHLKMTLGHLFWVGGRCRPQWSYDQNPSFCWCLCCYCSRRPCGGLGCSRSRWSSGAGCVPWSDGGLPHGKEHMGVAWVMPTTSTNVFLNEVWDLN